MTRLVLVYLLPAALNVGLGVFVGSRNWESRDNRLLALGCACLGTYCFRLFEVHSRSVEEAQVIFGALAFGPMFAGAFLSDFLFSVSRNHLVRPRPLEVAIIYLPTTFFALSYALTDWIFAGFRLTDSGAYIPLPGPLVQYPLYFLLLLGLIAVAQTVRRLVRTSDGIQRKQLLWSVSGIGLALLLCILVWLLKIRDLYSLIAPLSTVFVSGCMAVAVLKYGLLPSTEQLKREKAEAEAQQAELSRQILDSQMREERLRHERVEIEAKAREAELEGELQTARQMQMGLMPKESPDVPGLDISGQCVPANHVGGDYFQYFLEEDRLTVALADVTGKAMEAAIPVVMFSGILRSQMELQGTLLERFNRLNRSLVGAMSGRAFVSLVMGELDISSRSFAVCNAAFPYPYHYCAARGHLLELEVSAYPLGVRTDTEYETVEARPEPGDMLVFCSDGIVETIDPRGNLLGYDRTSEIVQTACSEDSAESTLDRILHEVGRFRGEAPQVDDMTCVVVRLLL